MYGTEVVVPCNIIFLLQQTRNYNDYGIKGQYSGATLTIRSNYEGADDEVKIAIHTYKQVGLKTFNCILNFEKVTASIPQQLLDFGGKYRVLVK